MQHSQHDGNGEGLAGHVARVVAELNALSVIAPGALASEYLWPVANIFWRLFTTAVVSGSLSGKLPDPTVTAHLTEYFTVMHRQPLTPALAGIDTDGADRSVTIDEAFELLRDTLGLRSPKDLYRIGPRLGITRPKLSGTNRVLFSAAAIARVKASMMKMAVALVIFDHLHFSLEGISALI